MPYIGVVSAILEDPVASQLEFNNIVASFKGYVRGRMGIPFDEEGLTVISIVVAADIDEINRFTGLLGNLPQVSVKTAISKRELKG